MNKIFYVYIATNKRNTVLYTGITNDLKRRMFEHKNRLLHGFCSKYNISKLVYFQTFQFSQEAISAEKKIKGWLRIKKIQLIKTINPELKELELSQ